jgi:hypothetical protein
MAHVPEPEEAVCPRCGADCEWSPGGGDRIVIVCSDCGQFELSTAEFGRAMGEMAQPEDPGSGSTPR